MGAEKACQLFREMCGREAAVVLAGRKADGKWEHFSASHAVFLLLVVQAAWDKHQGQKQGCSSAEPIAGMDGG